MRPQVAPQAPIPQMRPQVNPAPAGPSNRPMNQPYPTIPTSPAGQPYQQQVPQGPTSESRIRSSSHNILPNDYEINRQIRESQVSPRNPSSPQKPVIPSTPKPAPVPAPVSVPVPVPRPQPQRPAYPPIPSYPPPPNFEAPPSYKPTPSPPKPNQEPAERPRVVRPEEVQFKPAQQPSSSTRIPVSGPVVASHQILKPTRPTAYETITYLQPATPVTRTYVSAAPTLTRSISQPAGIGSYGTPLVSSQVYLPPTYTTAPTYVNTAPIASYTQTPITRVVRPSYQAERILRKSDYTPSNPVTTYTTSTPRQVFNAAPAQNYFSSPPTYVNSAPKQVSTAPTYVSAAPTYVSSAPTYVNSTPNYVTSTHNYVTSTPNYVNSTPSYVNSAPYEVRREPVHSTVYAAAPADRIVNSTYTPMSTTYTPSSDLGASRIRSSSHNTIRSSRDGHLIRETDDLAMDEDLRTSKIVVSKANVDYYIDDNVMRNIRPVTELISSFAPRIDVGRFYQAPPATSVFATTPHSPVYNTPMLRGSDYVTTTPATAYVPYNQIQPVATRQMPVSSQQYVSNPANGPKYAYPVPITASFGRPSNLNGANSSPRVAEVIPTTTLVKRDENQGPERKFEPSGQTTNQIRIKPLSEEKSGPTERQSSDVKPRELDAGRASDSKEPLWND